MFDLPPLLRYNETRFLRILTDSLNKEKSPMEQKPNVLPLRMEDVSYQYEPDARPAVSHVTLEVERGSFVAVLGHNGSGKSTLAKLMNALFLPTEGRVLVCGMDTLTEERVWNIRRHAGMVFQNPDNQIVANVVREHMGRGLGKLAHAHGAEGRLHPADHFVLRHAQVFQPEGHILPHHVGHDLGIRVLEHHARMAADIPDPVLR